jgi:hypothetical protein
MHEVNGWEEDDDYEVCLECDGDGGHHNCGVDTCCCADPEDRLSDDWMTCEECRGSGYYTVRGDR